MQGLTFGTNISTDLPKFAATPNQTYRAAVLHYVDANQQLQPIIRAGKTHFHQVPEGQQGLGGFVCLSTDESIEACCKNTGLFNDPLYKIAIPIILYPTNYQGDITPGNPEIQILIVYERGWSKLNTINRGYPLQSNDFIITGKKQGKGVSLDFMPAGPAYWQTDRDMFGNLLTRAKAIVEGPVLGSIDKMLGRKVTLQEVENAVRAAAGLPPTLPPPPGIPAAPMLPGMSVAAPALPPFPAAAAAVPLAPSPSSLPGMSVAPTGITTAATAVSLPSMQTGPASAAQMGALGALLADAPDAP